MYFSTIISSCYNIPFGRKLLHYFLWLPFAEELKWHSSKTLDLNRFPGLSCSKRQVLCKCVFVSALCQCVACVPPLCVWCVSDCQRVHVSECLPLPSLRIRDLLRRAQVTEKFILGDRDLSQLGKEEQLEFSVTKNCIWERDRGQRLLSLCGPINVPMGWNQSPWSDSACLSAEGTIAACNSHSLSQGINLSVRLGKRKQTLRGLLAGADARIVNLCFIACALFGKWLEVQFMHLLAVHLGERAGTQEEEQAVLSSVLSLTGYVSKGHLIFLYLIPLSVNQGKQCPHHEVTVRSKLNNVYHGS